MKKTTIQHSDILRISDAAKFVFDRVQRMPYDDSRSVQIFLVVAGLIDFLQAKGIEVPFDLADMPKGNVDHTPLDDM